MNRSMLVLATLVLLPFVSPAQPAPQPYGHTIDYFIANPAPDYDPDVPLPGDVLGYEIGEQHAGWNDVVNYMYRLAEVSERVSIKKFGSSYQHRPFIQVVITSPQNQRDLEQLRAQHLQLTDTARSGELNTGNMPVVVNLMYSVHGNEATGVNSSLVLAYYFAAAQGADIERCLNDVIIVLTPGMNPDGINRFASWVNSSRSFTNVPDLNSREFSEPWPSSRTNHYWADCNRDWLMAQHPEGQNALDMYFEWMPNVVNDHHEQGGDKAPFYFSPGHPDRVNPMTPERNQQLTAEITAYTARYLDKIGVLYYSKEGYDDYYYGKGSSYVDIYGSVGILFEQLASRGHLRPTRNNGLMSLASGIRNQAFAGFATIEAALDKRQELLDYQRGFFLDMKSGAVKEQVQGYVFNARGDKATMYHFLENLLRHRIDIYKLARRHTTGTTVFEPEDSYVIPVDQKNHLTVRTLMEDVKEFPDSTFYDITTWTFPHAYNLSCEALRSVRGLTGDPVLVNEFPAGELAGPVSSVGYIFRNDTYYSPRMINALLEKGLIIKAATKPFTCNINGTPQQFGYGTILIPSQQPALPAERLHRLLSTLSTQCGVTVHAMDRGLTRDLDLGSVMFKVLDLPRAAMIVGPGMGIPESGEIWMMFDRRFGMQLALIDHSKLQETDLTRYNVIIMANGMPTGRVNAGVNEKLRDWVTSGGLLIATGRSYLWTNGAKITAIETIPPLGRPTGAYQPYASRTTGPGPGNSIYGVILECSLDPTHPVGWGFDQESIAVFRKGTHAFHTSGSASPLYYSTKPLLSGCISPANLERLAGTPAVIVEKSGKGSVVVFADDMNFRSYCYGTSRLFMNAVIFGQLL